MGSTNYPQIDICLYSYHLFCCYCIDIVGENYFLFIHAGHEIVPKTVTNATKFFTLATKS